MMENLGTLNNRGRHVLKGNIVEKAHNECGWLGENKAKEKHLHNTSVALEAWIGSKLLVSAEKTINNV